MTTSNAAAAKAGTEKHSEKLAEKRRALGRGLESLLPGPRVAVATPTLPQSARKDGAPDVASSQFPVLSSQGARSSSAADFAGGRAQTPVAPPDFAVPETVDTLQASASGLTPEGEPVFVLALDQIDQNPYQTRIFYDEKALQELADSITVQGVLQPIMVRPGKEGRYILILGERRMRGSNLAGKTTIPAIVRRVSEQQAAEMTLVENLQRQDLNCVDQGAAFSSLSKQFRLTQEQIGIRVGVSREQVANYMRLLTLPEGVIGALQKGTLTYSHARTLLQLRDNALIWRLAQKVIAEGMSVKKLEDLVFGASTPTGSSPGRLAKGGARWQDPNVKAAQRSLEEVLGMKVRIRDRGGRGKILIEYSTLEDFDRVVTMLKGK